MPICFDLDGTLGTFGGGYVLLRETLGELWGRTPTPEELRACRGSTDWEIVDELHRIQAGGPISASGYGAFEARMLARFQREFHPQARRPQVFDGILGGLHLLARRHPVWLVSGNVPGVLEFKARALGVDPAVRLQGSEPGLDRAALILRALDGCPGPHLYVGDRPHDREAADRAGVAFLGIGAAVPGPHPILDPDAEAHRLLEAVERLCGGPAGIR